MENTAMPYWDYCFLPKNYRTYAKNMTKGPYTRWQNYSLCTILMYQHGGSILWTRRQLCTSHSRANCTITPSVITLINKSSISHTASLFWHRELVVALLKWQNNGTCSLFGIIDHTLHRGQNYRTNTIVIVHLATLVSLPTVQCKTTILELQPNLLLCLMFFCVWWSKISV